MQVTITITGRPEDIAALAVGMQGRQEGQAESAFDEAAILKLLLDKSEPFKAGE